MGSSDAYSRQTASATHGHRCWAAQRTPSRPIRQRRSGSATRAAIRSASAATSLSGTRKPVTPSRTVVTSPPTREAITGLPHAIASSATMPNDS